MSVNMEIDAMKKRVVTVGYPTIPVVFVGGIRPDRTPYYNTMGMAVTTEEDSMKTVTTVEVQPKEAGITFLVNGQPVGGGKRVDDLFGLVNAMLKEANADIGVKIDSINHNIFSGSSDAGVAALVVGLNHLLDTNLSDDRLIELGMKASESMVRSYVGGMNEINVDQYPRIKGIPVASAQDLKDIVIYALTFEGTRVTADEIHAAIVTHPEYKERVERTNRQVKEIKELVKRKDIMGAFATAWINILNAHYLLEGTKCRVRDKEMMAACIDVEAINKSGTPAFYLIGGGKQISIVCLRKDSQKVADELKNRGWDFKKYVVAPGAHVLDAVN